MPTNDQNFHQPRQIIYNEAYDFITCRHDRSLRPLRFTDISLSEFSDELEGYLSVLNGGGSIAFSRGEDLASIRLSKCLDNLFLTPRPPVREGQPLTWTRVVLFAGPHFEGPSKLKIGESLVELPEDDLELLRSGRPWRFLYPWPDKDDCEKELGSSETALKELKDARQIIHEGGHLIVRPHSTMVPRKLNQVMAVLENMLVVEQHLTNHHHVVAQLFQDQPHATLQEKAPKLGGARGNPLGEATSEARASREETLSDRDRPPTRGDTHQPNSDQTTLPIIEELHEKGEAGGSVSGNSMQHENPQPMSTASQAPRLHLSDFVQNLGEVLDDPRNTEAMRWSEDGQSIFLALEDNFPAHLLARLSTKSYQSLVRRLYYHGFRKIGGAYRHDLFIRSRPSSILPVRQMSHSPSHSSPMRNSVSRSGPRYKVIKKRRARQSV